MKHYVKVLSLAAPLSFVLGLGITYYRDQLKKDPNFLKPHVNVLAIDGLELKETFKAVESKSGFAIKVTTCESTDDCKKRFGPMFDLAILTPSIIKELVKTDSLSELNPEIKSLISRAHVDFRRPYFDPEVRFSLPLLWNVLGFLCPNELCESHLDVSWKEIKTEQQSKFIFVPDKLEHERLSQRGVWKEFQYHTFGDKDELIKEDKRPVVQWPSGGVRDKALFELRNYQYRLPTEGASIVIYSLVFPKKASMESKTVKFAQYLMSDDFVSQAHKASLSAFAVEPSAKTLSRLNKRQTPQALRRFPLHKLIFEEAQF